MAPRTYWSILSRLSVEKDSTNTTAFGESTCNYLINANLFNDFLVNNVRPLLMMALSL